MSQVARGCLACPTALCCRSHACARGLPAEAAAHWVRRAKLLSSTRVAPEPRGVTVGGFGVVFAESNLPNQPVAQFAGRAVAQGCCCDQGAGSGADVVALLVGLLQHRRGGGPVALLHQSRVELCLLYTSDAADDLLCVDLGGRRII